MDTLFSVLAFFLFLQSIVAFLSALRFLRRATRTTSATDFYAPKAAVVVPCKGIEPGFAENINALLAQDYRRYDLIFVTESEADPAYAALTDLIKESDHAAWLVVAGESEGRGQKVHNLCAALEMLDAVDRRTEVLVFADADARPAPHWLRELVAPLGNQRVGATTGFRWHTPVNFLSSLLSTWNASAAGLLGERSSFAWGGAMAIRREDFERLQIKQDWQGAVSDDYTLSRAVLSSGMDIKFVPACLMPSEGGMTLGGLLEFTTRQLIITRFYAPRLWRLAAFAHALFNLTFWGGLAYELVKASLMPGGEQGSEMLLPLLAGIYALGACTGGIRALTAAKFLPEPASVQVRKHLWAYALLGPVASLLYLYNLAVSAFTNRIVWRGIGYELRSPEETFIWQRPLLPEMFDQPLEPRERKSSEAAPSSS